MSYRSALNNPLPSSGNIGAGFFGIQNIGNISLLNGVDTTINSVTIGAGLWSVKIAYLALTSNQAFNTLTQTLTNSDGDILSTKLVLGKAGALSGFSGNQFLLPIQNYVIIRLDAPTTLTLKLLVKGSTVFKVNTISSNPESLKYIRATKLA